MRKNGVTLQCLHFARAWRHVVMAMFLSKGEEKEKKRTLNVFLFCTGKFPSTSQVRSLTVNSCFYFPGAQTREVEEEKTISYCPSQISSVFPKRKKCFFDAMP